MNEAQEIMANAFDIVSRARARGWARDLTAEEQQAIADKLPPKTIKTQTHGPMSEAHKASLRAAHQRRHQLAAHGDRSPDLIPKPQTA